jgi:predicted metalloprotease with PDZ domain
MKSISKLTLSFCLFFGTGVLAQQPVHMQYSVSMEKAAEHLYHVELTNKTHLKTLDFKMCVWTPGYYQLIDFAGAVQNFTVTDARGNSLKFDKPAKDTWKVNNPSAGDVKISYDVKAVVPFVGNVYLDETRGYITPGGVFMYLDQELRHPVTIKMKPYSKWNNLVATGLDTLKGQYHVYKAADFDVLYDSPFLMGELEVLPPFDVQNKPHNFIGYKLPAFDRQAFMDDLKKIVVTGSNIIGEIPYTHYTFLSIGAGGGGIEHLNSTSLSFSGGEGFNTPDARKKLYNFIAHEYFHHYNVKRIRPVELGPFDYSKENHTNMLWVSEGFTVYYEYMITRHAGLMNNEDMFGDFQNNLRNYENEPGHLYQSATQASYNTWDDGPNGRQGDDFNKTISYYDKASTVKPPDYPKYFALGGLMVDTATKVVSESWAGLNVRQQGDTLRINTVAYKSPAWDKGIRGRTVILTVDGTPATKDVLFKAFETKNTGDNLTLGLLKNGERKDVTIVLGRLREKTFKITPLPNADQLQSAIFRSWTEGK